MSQELAVTSSTQGDIGPGSLVLYKTRPALVKRAGDKLEIRLEDGKTLKVRPKDVVLLHPGPVETFNQLSPREGEVRAAWELLAGETTTLAELAELAYGEHTPATAWATWQWVDDGLYFGGVPEAIEVHAADRVARERAARAARAEEAAAWESFLERVRHGQFAPEDDRYLREVEQLAVEQRDKSRVMQELGRAQTPENAHALLLEVGYWDSTVDPYPIRLNVPLQSPSLPLPDLPSEQRVDLTHLQAYAIDDAGSTDPDDALSLEPATGRLWVHVADVAALVWPDSPADLEARSRGASLYLPEGTITMLPAAATAQLGLGLHETSPALSFGLDVNAWGEITHIEIVPSWVQVTRLTYEEAETRLSEEPLRSLNTLTLSSENRRREAGATFIDLPEVKIAVIEGAVHVRPLAALRSREMVAESMLMAGEAAARFAMQRNLALPYTTQDPAEPLDLPDTMAGMFARRRTLRRSQQSSVPSPHAGLGLEVYARATSPLRRYLDLVVHQQLRAYYSGRPVLDAQAVLERVGAAEAVLGAMRQAERLARQHWTLVYLLQNPDWRGEAMLVETYGLRGTFLIPELGLETRLHLREELPLNSKVILALVNVNLPALDAFFRIETR